MPPHPHQPGCRRRNFLRGLQPGRDLNFKWKRHSAARRRMALFLSEWCNFAPFRQGSWGHSADSAVCRVGRPRTKKLHGPIVHNILNSMVFINTVMCAAKLIWRRICPAALDCDGNWAGKICLSIFPTQFLSRSPTTTRDHKCRRSPSI